MKRLILFSTICLVLSASLNSCKKLDDTNINPNSPESVTPNVQLTASELSIGYTIGGDIARYSGVLTQHIVGADRQFSVFDRYNFVNSDFDQPWQNTFLTLKNLNDLAVNSDAKGYNTYVGVANILSAYTLGTAADLWNGVPYSEALQGFDNLQPKFQSQAEIFVTVQNLLDSGIARLAMDPGVKTPSSDDVIYGGDVVRWQKLAYSLKARFYLHQRKVDATNIAKAEAAILNGFSSSADDAYVYFGSTSKSANPYYQFQQQRPGYLSFASSNAANMMTADNDPRLDYLIDVTNDDLGSFYNQPSSGIQLITYAELLFIQAEIDFIKGDKSSAAQHHNDASIESVTAITGGALTSAWVTAKASETSSSITLETIMTQKYLATFLNPETFSDWRRTGFPVLTPNAGAVTLEIPRRFLYAQTEVERNSNTPSGTQITDKVDWDK